MLGVWLFFLMMRQMENGLIEWRVKKMINLAKLIHSFDLENVVVAYLIRRKSPTLRYLWMAGQWTTGLWRLPTTQSWKWTTLTNLLTIPYTLKGWVRRISKVSFLFHFTKSSCVPQDLHSPSASNENDSLRDGSETADSTFRASNNNCSVPFATQLNYNTTEMETDFPPKPVFLN